MKRDQYQLTLKRIQKTLESVDQRQALSALKKDIHNLKQYIPERLSLLEKFIKTLNAQEKANKNAFALLKQTPKDITKHSNRVLKDSQSLLSPALQNLVKEFHTISKEFSNNYAELLKKNGIK